MRVKNQKLVGESIWVNGTLYWVAADGTADMSDEHAAKVLKNLCWVACVLRQPVLTAPPAPAPMPPSAAPVTPAPAPVREVAPPPPVVAPVSPPPALAPAMAPSMGMPMDDLRKLADSYNVTYEKTTPKRALVAWVARAQAERI